MNVLFDFPKYKISDVVITVGTFDGVHLGHKKIIRQTVKIAQKKSFNSVVIAFSEPPKNFFLKENKVPLLTTVDEKISLIEKLKVDYLIILDFDESIANLSAKQFLDKLYEHFDIKHLIFGFNHHFGKNREGDAFFVQSLLKFYGFEFTEVAPIYFNYEIVSSSAIRQAILDDNLKKANLFLGYNYFLSGTVVKGKNIGSKIGFPTANIVFDSKKLIPNNGVYATITEIDNQKFWSMTNVGFKPTVGKSSEKSVETHILGFNKNIYGKKIKIYFLRKIREEKKFQNIQLLAEQLNKDKQTVKQILVNYSL